MVGFISKFITDSSHIVPGLWLYNLNQHKQHQPLSPNHVLFQEVNSTCFIRGSSDPYYGFTLFQRI